MGDTAEIRQLESEGYQFHGAYSSTDKEGIKRRAAELRKEGHKARVVYEPGSKYARGYSGGGWSIYWIESEASIAARKEKDKRNTTLTLENEKTKLLTRIEEIETQLVELAKKDK